MCGVSVPRPARLSLCDWGCVVRILTTEAGREGRPDGLGGTVSSRWPCIDPPDNRMVPAVRAFPPQSVRQCCGYDVRAADLMSFSTAFSGEKRLWSPPARRPRHLQLMKDGSTKRLTGYSFDPTTFRIVGAPIESFDGGTSVQFIAVLPLQTWE